MDIGYRIKQLRKSLRMNQTEFGDRLCVQQATVSGWEKSIRLPSDSTINSICFTFNVNESWLRDGVGDMFVAKSRDEELAEFFGHISGLDDTFKKRFMRILAELSEEGWIEIEKAVRKVLEMNKAPEDPAP